MSENDYLIEVSPGLADVKAEEWDALLAAQARPTPFMRHAWLSALIDSGSAVPETGWQPLALALRTPDRQLVGASLAWLKSHSYGEYVFDWAWADAYRRHGLDYYPKLLVAVPFTPVPGSRLLARGPTERRHLVQGLQALAQRAGASSIHLLFGDDADFEATASAGWMARQGVQFHWQADPAAPCADFEALLARMQHDKRKKIRQERRKVAEAGVRFEAREGLQIRPDDWAYFYRCYALTYQQHRSSPYLSPAFFAAMQGGLAGHWLLFTAWQGEDRIGCALVAIDREHGTAWGRYWGATAPVPCLHFEACYYQPLQWCLTQGFTRFEGGAQGEHKMARGLLPCGTGSAHWVADTRFAQAIGEHLAQEGAQMADYMGELEERSPFHRGALP